MDSNPQPAHGSVKMRANRKVVESRCGICGGDFAFGEEVYSCPACGGYHHTYCLESGTRCPQATAVAAEIQLKHDAFAPPVRWETAPPSEQPSIPTPPSPLRPPLPFHSCLLKPCDAGNKLRRLISSGAQSNSNEPLDTERIRGNCP